MSPRINALTRRQRYKPCFDGESRATRFETFGNIIRESGINNRNDSARVHYAGGRGRGRQVWNLARFMLGRVIDEIFMDVSRFDFERSSKGREDRIHAEICANMDWRARINCAGSWLLRGGGRGRGGVILFAVCSLEFYRSCGEMRSLWESKRGKGKSLGKGIFNRSVGKENSNVLGRLDKILSRIHGGQR